MKVRGLPDFKDLGRASFRNPDLPHGVILGERLS
jgi:hypothetical protein